MMSRVAVALVLAWGAVAAAEVRTSKAAQVSIEIPASWKIDAKDELMRGESADKSVALFFWVVDSADAKEALKKLDGELYQAIAKLTWEPAKATKIHGLAASYVDGHGTSVGSRSSTADRDVLAVAWQAVHGVPRRACRACENASGKRCAGYTIGDQSVPCSSSARTRAVNATPIASPTRIASARVVVTARA